MRPLLTPDEMSAADAKAIEAGTPAATLMDRAGRHVAHAALRVMGRRYGRRVVVVCGKGNNGGDGFVAARVLAGAGVRVRCTTVGDVKGETGAAAVHRGAWLSAGGTIEPFDPVTLDRADVVIDAIFGTGFTGRAEGDAASAIEAIEASGAPVVAVDIPSGVDGSTGAVRGPAITAHTTVAIAAAKLGVAIGDGALRAGRVEVVDIEIPIPLQVPLPPHASAAMLEASDVAAVLPHRPRDAHKRSSGTVAVLAGSDQMTGAAVLCVRGALRMGAGYANLGCTETVRSVAAQRLPEALTQVVSDADVLGGEAVLRFKGVIERAGAVAVGPGIGTGPDQKALVERLLREVEATVVADADALNVLAESPDVMAERGGPLVITPHPGEVGRLLGTGTDEVQRDRLAAVREVSARFGCITVLKGFRSLIADPEGRVVVNPAGGPELATAGTGDVLTGAVAALVAAGVEPFEAAYAASFVHGVAGRLARPGGSEAGLVAWDVAEALPRAVAAIDSRGPEGDAWD